MLQADYDERDARRTAILAERARIAEEQRVRGASHCGVGTDDRGLVQVQAALEKKRNEAARVVTRFIKQYAERKKAEKEAARAVRALACVSGG
jgi:hypothetical protein